MALIDTVISVLIQRTKENGGGTVSPIGLATPNSGFMVGGYIDSLIFDEGLLSHGTIADSLIHDFVSNHAAFSSRFDIFLGGWIDTETHLFYADLSKHFTDKEEAILAAKQNDEIAIWDLGNEEEIRVS